MGDSCFSEAGFALAVRPALIDYGNVSIMRSTHTCDPFSLEQDIRTAITFKRDACPKLSN